MTLRSFSHAFLLVPALLLLPLGEGCTAATQDQSVGTNTSPITDPCTGADGGLICSEPNIPPGCHLGTASCVGGEPQCPPVVCPADAGGCSGEGVICGEPNVGPGCHLGASSCVNGKFQCPPVICPAEGGAPPDGGATTEAGACSGEGVVCNLPNVPVGCHVGKESCVDGQYECPPVVCPVGEGGCSGDGVTCSEPAIGPGCHLGKASCVNGQYQCPPVVCM
jgi:hypothetical protein